MPKRKHRDESEFFKGRLRERDKLIRSLQRRVKELEKQQHMYIDPTEENSQESTQQPTCSKCRIGYLLEQDFKHVIYNVCNNSECRHREKKTSTR